MSAPIRFPRYLIVLGFLVVVMVVVYAVSPQLSSFGEGLTAVKGANLGYLAAAFAVFEATFFVAAVTYMLVSRSHLRYPRVVLITIANMFTNRLLPGGTGGMATVYLFLRRNRHTAGQASSVIAVNNTLGMFGHVFLLLGLVIFWPTSMQGITLPAFHGRSTLFVVGLVVLVLLVSMFVKKSWHTKIARILNGVGTNIKSFYDKPLCLSGGLLSSAILTMCNVASLWLCVLAVHGSISFAAAFAVFTIGIFASTATPTPGGLGGAEVALVAGLVAFHVSSPQALAAVLLYRLISFWLPLLFGFAAFTYATRSGYLAKV